MSRNKLNFLNYINNFRGFVILLIVAVHCVASQLLQWSNQSELRAVLKSILHGSSIFYVFIAGYLFKVLIEKYKYHEYLRRKIMYVFIPYLIISVPAIVDEIANPKSIYKNLLIWEQVIVYYSTGIHMAHFWFIPMIMIYYILSPVFVWINKVNIYYLMVPLFLLSAIWVPREIYPTHNPFMSALHFMGFYLLGMWCATNNVYIYKIFKHYGKGVLISIILFYLSWIMDFEKERNISIINFLYVLKFSIMTVTLTAIFKRFDGIISNSFGFLAGQSFGIYFLHNYFIVLFEKIILKINIKLEGTIICLMAVTTLVVISSMLLIYIIRRFTANNSKYIIGC